MKYIEFRIHASSQGVEMVSELLMRNGITGISVEDPSDLQDILSKKNEYGWDYIDDEVKERKLKEPIVRAYLEDSEEGREQLQSLKLQIMNLKSLELEGRFGWDVDFGRLYAEAEVVDDTDWKDRWKEHFKPARITDRLVVRPSWENYEAKAGDLVIELDPGMAFGTGTHETTRLCMQLIEKYGEGRIFGQPGASAEEAGEDGCLPGADEDGGSAGAGKSGSFLDVGCGSGILSIGAALLGCRDVLGVEIDPDAVAAAQENVRANHLEQTVRVQEGDLTEGIGFKADMIAANLMADLVVKLAGSCSDHLKDGGIFISSGILIEKEEEVADAVRRAGFDIIEIAEDGEWCAIAAEKRQI